MELETSILKKIRTKLRSIYHTEDKKVAELNFWKNLIEECMQWYEGKLPSLYGENSPTEKDKVQEHSLKDSAILTWHKTHQETKYLQDLILDSKAFSGMKLLDIGSGPIPSATVFENCEVYCLDPLLADYVKIGFPIHYYENTKFISSPSENIPVVDHFFDAIISVNAIDHVDDFYKTAAEIKRILKPDGKLRMHVHYHKKTEEEPTELNDQKMNEMFGWCKNFKKISESRSKRGFTLTEKDEMYTVWSN